MKKTETFSFNVNAKEPDTGVPIPIPVDDFSELKVTNNSGTTASYSANGGGTFADMASGTTIIIGYGEKSQYLFRKKTSDWISFTVTVTYPGNDTVGVLSDRRKLSKWFDGGIDGKVVVMSGDSTTWYTQSAFAAAPTIYRDGRYSRIQQKFPEFKSVTVYSRGENGVSLTTFKNTLVVPLTDNHRNDPTSNYYAVDTYGNLDALIALNADVYILCWGINDCRVTSTYTATNLKDGLTEVVNILRAAVPKCCIILRMPNAHSVDCSGITGGATAQSCMDRYQTAYGSLRNTWPDVVVWNSMGVFPVVAPATAAGSPTIAADGLHMSTSALDQTVDQLFGMLRPAVNHRDLDIMNEGSRAIPFKDNPTNRLLRWDPNIDPKILEGPDWYKVYRVQFSDGARASYIRIQFKDYEDLYSTPVRDNAWASGVPAQGIVPGDIISLANKTGQAYTFVVNQLTPSIFGTTLLQWVPHPAGTWSAAETEDLVAGHPVPPAGVIVQGFVYRHKYAHCEAMRSLQSLLVPPLGYDAAVGTVNNYAVKRRFYISATPALGAFTAQTIGSETGGDLSLRTWAVTDTVYIPGISSGAKTGAEFVNALKFPLTGGVFTADTVNKRMAVTGVTSGGVLVDFSKYVIPQGYVLSAT